MQEKVCKAEQDWGNWHKSDQFMTFIWQINPVKGVSMTSHIVVLLGIIM